MTLQTLDFFSSFQPKLSISLPGKNVLSGFGSDFEVKKLIFAASLLRYDHMIFYNILIGVFTSYYAHWLNNNNIHKLVPYKYCVEKMLVLLSDYDVQCFQLTTLNNTAVNALSDDSGM